jgi:endo-beta-N-acetylglucosaminidase D
MAKKCIYCKTDVPEESVIDFCKRCGVGVWGEKMFNAIVESMEKSRVAGDLFQGSVSSTNIAQKL